MKLTRRHRIYAGVLAAGAAALVIDRVFVLGPEASSAASATAVAPQPAPVAGPAEAAASGSETRPAASVLADRLSALGREHEVDLRSMRDAFTLSQGWLARHGVSGASMGPAAQRFQAAHRLEGVMAGGRGGYAIVDGRCLYIGQRLDGFTLVSVGERSAVLESETDRVELVLPRVGVTRPSVR